VRVGLLGDGFFDELMLIGVKLGFMLLHTRYINYFFQWQSQDTPNHYYACPFSYIQSRIFDEVDEM
jgi:hypothetical protein